MDDNGNLPERDTDQADLAEYQQRLKDDPDYDKWLDELEKENEREGNDNASGQVKRTFR